MPTTLSSPLYIVCRKGNDSQLAVVQLLTHGIECKDIEGGLEAWAEHIDPEFPIY
ncbi:Urmylation protein [Coelomomyces lativittatus]|nr:Urmylation protein [Coelomomyces lativittatus]KAJ1510229.1 Urmylation protein [Coelomomyces lativittatus]